MFKGILRMPQIITVVETEAFDTLYNEYRNEHDVRLEFSTTRLVTDKITELSQYLMKENSLNRLCLDFTNHPLSDEDSAALAMFLQSDNCPPSVTLILTRTFLSKKSLEILAGVIVTGCNASQVSLGLCNNRLGNEGAQLFARALKSEHCPSTVSLNLASNDISDQGFLELADMMKSLINLKKLSLNLLFNPTTRLGSFALIDGIKCGENKERLDIKYEFSKHGTGVICSLANALKSKQCPEELALQFGPRHFTTDEVGILFSALGLMTNRLDLDLSEQGLKDEGFAVILKALQDMNGDLKLKLRLIYNAIKQDGAQKLADFITSGRLRSEVYMSLSQNSFGGEAGIRMIRDAIVSNPQILHYLTIDGPTNEINDLCARIREQGIVELSSNAPHKDSGCTFM